MSFLEDLLVGERIAAIHVDSELTYVMLTNGSQITIRGLVVVEPPPATFIPLEQSAASQLPLAAPNARTRLDPGPSAPSAK